MTPQQNDGFIRFFKLRDLDTCDAEPLFEALVALIIWDSRERRLPTINDAILDKAIETTSVTMGLLLHLATVDRIFYRLARRMAARTLVRHEHVAPVYRHMAAALLDSDPPRQNKPYVARDTLLILAVAVGQMKGWHPYEATSADRPNRSGCARLARVLAEENVHHNYDAIAKVWTRRREKLSAAGFTAEEISELFVSICPMISKPD